MKVREPLKTELALLRGTVENVVAGGTRGSGGKVPSAPEMEELGKDEGGGAAGTNSSSIESTPSGCKENKDLTTEGPSRRGAAPSPGHGALYALLLYSGSSSESTEQNTICYSKEEFKGPCEGHKDPDVG